MGVGNVQVSQALQFPLVVLASFVLSSVLFSFVAVGTAGDLAGISKHTEAWGEVVGLLGWKGVQLAVCWFGGLDGMCFPLFLLCSWRGEGELGWANRFLQRLIRRH